MLSFQEFLIEAKYDVVHGSGTKFTKFSQAHARLKNDYYGGGVAYFTDHHETGKNYAKNMSKKTKTPHLYHSTLEMHNVFDVDKHYTGEHLTHLLPKDHETFARHAGLLKLGDDKYHTLGKLASGSMSMTGDQIFRGLSHGMSNTSKARDHLIKKGYDGLRYNGGIQTRGIHHNVYIPYKDDAITINKIEKL